MIITWTDVWNEQRSTIDVGGTYAIMDSDCVPVYIGQSKGVIERLGAHWAGLTVGPLYEFLRYYADQCAHWPIAIYVLNADNYGPFAVERVDFSSQRRKHEGEMIRKFSPAFNTSGMAEAGLTARSRFVDAYRASTAPEKKAGAGLLDIPYMAGSISTQ